MIVNSNCWLVFASSDRWQCNSSIYVITHLGQGGNLIWDQVLRFNASAVIITIYVIFSLNRHIFRKIKKMVIDVHFKLVFSRANGRMHRYAEYGSVGGEGRNVN